VQGDDVDNEHFLVLLGRVSEISKTLMDSLAGLEFSIHANHTLYSITNPGFYYYFLE